jgi:predicted DNA-binding protein with PD1-like motif
MVQTCELKGASGAGERTFALRFAEGEEVVSTLLAFSERREIVAAQITGIGAFSDVKLGFFDLQRHEYHENTIAEQIEVLSLIGNLAEFEGKPKLHAHIVVGNRDGAAMGGHLLSGHVRPTLELIVTEAPAHLRRKTDSKTGLALLDIEETA